MRANYYVDGNDPAWLTQVTEWVEQSLEPLGRVLAGPLEPVRIMPWAAVYRGPTEAGDVYFKAVAGTQGHEPALVSFLAQRRPDCNLPVLGMNVEQGWLLLPDGGRTFAGLITEQRPLFDAWGDVLSLAAGLQRSVELEVGLLKTLGVPEKSPHALLGVYQRLIQQPELLRVGQPGSLVASEVETLLGFNDRLIAAFDKLELLGIPMSLVHEEAGGRHIFVSEEFGHRRCHFFDWGDACLGHPFMWAMMPLRDLAEDFPKAAAGGLEPIIATYLRPWLEFAPMVELQRGLGAATLAAALHRLGTWLMVDEVYGAGAPQFVLDLYPQAMAYWLRRIGGWLDRYEAGHPLLP